MYYLSQFRCMSSHSTIFLILHRHVCAEMNRLCLFLFYFTVCLLGGKRIWRIYGGKTMSKSTENDTSTRQTAAKTYQINTWAQVEQWPMTQINYLFLIKLSSMGAQIKLFYIIVLWLSSIVVYLAKKLSRSRLTRATSCRTCCNWFYFSIVTPACYRNMGTEIWAHIRFYWASNLPQHSQAL